MLKWTDNKLLKLFLLCMCPISFYFMLCEIYPLVADSRRRRRRREETAKTIKEKREEKENRI